MYFSRVATAAFSIAIVFLCGPTAARQLDQYDPVELPQVVPGEPVTIRHFKQNDSYGKVDPALGASAGWGADYEDRIALWVDLTVVPQNYEILTSYLRWTRTVSDDGLWLAVVYLSRPEWNQMTTREQFHALGKGSWAGNSALAGTEANVSGFPSIYKGGAFLLCVQSRGQSQVQNFGQLSVTTYVSPPPTLDAPADDPTTPLQFPITLKWTNPFDLASQPADIVQIAYNENFTSIAWEHPTEAERIEFYTHDMDVLTGLQLFAADLPPGRTLYWRVRTPLVGLSFAGRPGGWSEPRRFRTAAPGSDAPTAPYITSFLPRQRVGTTVPPLETSAFESTAGRTHFATEWFVSRDRTFNKGVWRAVDRDDDLLRETIPPFTLQKCRYYTVRARHQDDRGVWSDWSPPTEWFTPCDLTYIDHHIFGDRRFELETRPRVQAFQHASGVETIAWNDRNWEAEGISPHAIYFHQTVDGATWTSGKTVLPENTLFLELVPGYDGTVGVEWMSGVGNSFGIDLIDGASTLVTRAVLDESTDGWGVFSEEESSKDFAVTAPAPGVWLGAWFRRKTDRAQIAIRRSVDDGATWTPTIALDEFPRDITYLRAEFFTDDTSTVLLYIRYTFNGVSFGSMFRSNDYGASWNGPEPDPLPDGTYSLDPLLLGSHGTWIYFPVSAGTPQRSTNAGRTWKPVRLETARGLDDPPKLVGIPATDGRGNWIAVGGPLLGSGNSLDALVHYYEEYHSTWDASDRRRYGEVFWISRDDGRTWYGPEWISFRYPDEIADKLVGPPKFGFTSGTYMRPDGTLRRTLNVWTDEYLPSGNYETKRQYLMHTAHLENMTKWLDFKQTSLGDGSAPYPYSRLASAVAAVPDLGSIQLARGSAAETIRIEKPVRLVASDGTVLIGALDPELNVVESAQHPQGRIVLPPPPTGDTTVNSREFWTTSTGGGTLRTEVDEVGEHGQEEAVPAGLVYEPVFPVGSGGAAVSLLTPNTPVAVRLLSVSGITPGSVVGEVSGLNGSGRPDVRWFPVSTSDLRDIWVVFEPDPAWSPEARLTFRAFARSDDDSLASSAEYVFSVGGELSAASTGPNTAARWVPSENSFGAEQLGIANVGVIHPATAYEEIQTVRMQLPEGATTSLWYYKMNGENSAWYPASEVLGFVERGPKFTRDEPGEQIEFDIRHGGIVGFAESPPAQLSIE